MFHELSLVINGEPHTLGVRSDRFLLELLREDLGLRGTKIGCDGGDCGACTVLVNGVPRYACLTLAVQVDGQEITTVEALGTVHELHPLQELFLELGAVQCGYCTPGILMTTKALLNRNPTPSVDEIKHELVGNLCRCTGWTKIIEAVVNASASEVKWPAV